VPDGGALKTLRDGLGQFAKPIQLRLKRISRELQIDS
jgi:hypothetical protein